MIEIDGSFGEGGGQILRTSLGLSLVTGTAFCIDNIRAKRKNAGLLRQHLTAVLAAAKIGQAEVEGAALGSGAVRFVPGKVVPGEYTFSVGTAGSATLVLQTVLPALLVADGPSRLVLEGGTHNMAAPPFDFVQKTFLPLIERMGPHVSVQLERYGFYPAGGGRFTVDIMPCAKLQPLVAVERGEIQSRRVVAVVANVKRHVAEREVRTAGRLMHWGYECQVVEEIKGSVGPGNVVMIEIASDAATEVFTAFGKLGVLAEKVADEVSREAREYLGKSAVAGEHLADQLLLPMAMAGGGAFTAVNISQHATTNMEVIRKFLPVDFRYARREDHVWEVEVRSGL